MKNKKSAKEEFIEYITEVNRIKGLDELSSKIIGNLYSEPEDLSLEELSKRTKYSLSAICTSTKFLERMSVLKRIKKPKSKKVYYYIEKDMMKKFTKIWKERYKKLISLSKKRIPEIIELYKSQKASKEELKIVKSHYNQILNMEKIMKKFIETLENETSN